MIGDQRTWINRSGTTLGKITKEQSKAHDKAVALLSKGTLSFEEREFVFRNWTPLAQHNVGKGGIFFTPWDAVWDFTVMTQPKGRVIDLCAGIGVLARRALDHDYSPSEITEMVCLEINPEFIEVGKILVPEATWVEGNVLDYELLHGLGRFDSSISNPPFGNIPTRQKPKWMKHNGPLHFMVMEVALRIAWNGGSFIIPESDTFGYRHDRDYTPSNLRKFLKDWPGTTVTNMPIDTSEYEFPGAKGIRVGMVYLDNDDVLWDPPYGFPEIDGGIEKAQEMALVNKTAPRVKVDTDVYGDSPEEILAKEEKERRAERKRELKRIEEQAQTRFI
jgi:hypothetical protein